MTASIADSTQVFLLLVQFAMRFSRLHIAMENGADRAKA
jgi:hypothetical protein